VKHLDPCNCHLHMAVTCDHCGLQLVGTTRLGTHVKKEHPEHFVPRRPTSAKRIAAKIVQSMEVAKEMKRLANRGVRFLPKSRLDKTSINMINAWIAEMSSSKEVQDNLLIAGFGKAERGVASQKEFLTLQGAIVDAAKLSYDNLPGLYKRVTQFQPQVAGEILKLAFALNKSWSFTTHLLLLYGLEAMAEELSTSGPQPPGSVSSPAGEVTKNQKEEQRMFVQAERDKKFRARNPNFDPDNRPAPYIIKE
jgi:hypothetical protein